MNRRKSSLAILDSWQGSGWRWGSCVHLVGGENISSDPLPPSNDHLNPSPNQASPPKKKKENKIKERNKERRKNTKRKVHNPSYRMTHTYIDGGSHVTKSHFAKVLRGVCARAEHHRHISDVQAKRLWERCYHGLHQTCSRIVLPLLVGSTSL